MIVIIDYGMGNIGSILNMMKKIGTGATISSDTAEIESAEKLILPGVGAFDNGMKNISDRGLIPILNKKVLDDKIPVLGICLGCQLITKSSEEGNLPGLGWIEARSVRFRFNDDLKNLKVPHMGWNIAVPSKADPVVAGLNGEQRFYFVHSYHLVCDHEEDVLMKTIYGYEFASAVKKDNVTGVQFHPEKSHKFGMNLLRNWVQT
jgi:imidazole glycerol-phosphate synthase subunit HisH